MADADSRSTYATKEPLLEEYYRIVESAERRNVLLRVMGSIAFRIHCPNFSYLAERMERKLTDIDFASYTKESGKVDDLLRDLGYTTQSYVQLAVATMGRSIYWNKDRPSMHVDVFWDRLSMNHTVDFKNRLENDKPTIPLPELLQEKFQIVNINLKDVKDVIMLIREHDVSEGETGSEVIDMPGIIKVLSNDWGYCYTFTENIKKVMHLLSQFETLSEEDRHIVSTRLSKMLNAIESAPKSYKWKLRAKIGTGRIWYAEVSEVSR